MGFFKKKEEKIKFSDEPIAFNSKTPTEYNAEVFQIMQNDGVNICAEACACCWDSTLPNKYKERATYISKRTKIGHGSVTEHSNHVFYMEVRERDYADLAEFLSKCRYVHTCFKKSDIYNKGYLIIGGSWRAFNDIIKMHTTIELSDNTIMARLLGAIYNYINSCGMMDLVEHKIIEGDKFVDSEDISNAIKMYSAMNNLNINESLAIKNVDSLDRMIENLSELCPEPELFSIYDLLDMCTITIIFNNLSRIITQQLVRHRNGITQASQRYINFKDAKFNSPDLFKDKYDSKHQYSIQFGKSSQKMTLQEIGKNIISIYGQLVDEKTTDKYKLQLEDARGYLPNNVQSGKLYMTFTWRSFFMFLYLREDLHSQAEIRKHAIELGKWFRESFDKYKDLYDALTPKSINESMYCYPLENDNSLVVDTIDEQISIEEIIEQMENQIQYQEKSDDKE